MKLTNEIRRDIVDAAIDYGYKDRKETLDKEELYWYNTLYTNEFKGCLSVLDQLPTNWFKLVKSYSVNANGWIIYLKGPERKYPMRNSSGCPYVISVPSEFIDDIQKFSINKEKYNSDRNSDYSALYGKLLSINTTNQLKESWPEGLPFYKKYLEMDKKKQLVAVFDSINEKLGLPIEGETV